MKCSLLCKRFGCIATSAALALTVGFGAVAPQEEAYAVTAAEKAAEAQEALNQLYAMQETLEASSAKYYQSLLDYQKAVERCEKAQKRIDEITKEIASIQGRLGQRAREMYRNGATSFIDVLLGATSFDEFTQNWDLLTRLNVNDADLSAKAKSLRDEAETKKAEYTEQAGVAERKSADASQAYEESKKLSYRSQFAMITSAQDRWNALSEDEKKKTAFHAVMLDTISSWSTREWIQQLRER